MMGLHVAGNRIQNADGDDVVLRGVNRSGTEYRCIDQLGIHDGPSDEASVRGIASWNANAVRVPLNEDCWLATGDVAESSSGEAYRQAIIDYVELLQKFNIVPILDLHWSSPAAERATGLLPLPSEQAVEFWVDVAERFKDNDGVVLEPFNEPYPDRNQDTDLAWQCWRDGCTTERFRGDPYEAIGMQALVDAIRGTGAANLILAGGVQFANGLTQWRQYKPDDPLDNLAVAWHVYDNNPCRQESCWNDVPAALAEDFPIVVTEFGQRDCQDAFVIPLMEWLEERDIGYLAWTWNAYGPCLPEGEEAEGEEPQPWSLISSWSGTPNSVYAEAVRARMLGL
jgi:hypothetical protein